MSTIRLYTLLGAKGGLGRSAIAVNLAVALARGGKGPKVALIDFDWLAGGSLASYLDMEPLPGNWRDVLERKCSLEAALKAGAHGVTLLGAPAPGGAPPPADWTFALLKRLARDFEAIVVDTTFPSPANALLPLLDAACTVLVPVAPDVTAISATKHLLDDLRSRHFPTDRFGVVLNREGQTTEIGAPDVEATLGRKLMGRVPYHPVIPSSLNRGVPLVAAAGSHPAAAALLAIAQAAASRPPVAIASIARSAALEQDTSTETGAPAAGAEAAPGPDAEQTTALSLHVDPKGPLHEAKLAIHARLVELMKLEDVPLERLSDPQFKAILMDQIAERVNLLIDELGIEVESRAERVRLVRDVADEAIGYGPLESLLADPGVSEIMVNGPSQIFVERKGQLTLSGRSFTDEKQLRVVIDRIVAPLGRRVDEASPMCDARLPDGSRVNVIIPPLALGGSTITIRKFSQKRLAISDLVGFGSMTDGMAAFLEACVQAKLNIFISGGTGSGKTTLLNVLSSFIPEGERIVTIEDAAELKLNQSHVVPLEARPPNVEGSGAVPIRDLVKNSLRMRPDRIIVGEVRGGEALDMLQAMNTGHDGSLATGHANTPRDALARLETMVLMAGMDLPVRAIREQIASAIHVIVQQTRLADGSRKVVKITEVTGMEGDVIALQDIFEFQQTGRTADGVVGEFRSTGVRPYCLDVMTEMGIELPAGLFRGGEAYR